MEVRLNFCGAVFMQKVAGMDKLDYRETKKPFRRAGGDGLWLDEIYKDVPYTVFFAHMVQICLELSWYKFRFVPYMIFFVCTVQIYLDFG